MKKTKIFISSGQQPDEEPIVKNIAEILSDHFEVYIAKHNSTLLPIPSEILSQLESSEYFLFIDFKRRYDCYCKCSMFSHQELAVAMYLGKDALCFQENGTKRIGLQEFIQSNPIKFNDRNKLSEIVIKKVNENWKSGWKYELSIFPTKEPEKQSQLDRTIRHFCHLDIKNQHKMKYASDCVAYLMRVNNDDYRFPLSWAGYQTFTLPMIIFPNESRKLDIFNFSNNSPWEIEFLNKNIIDSSIHLPQPINLKEEKEVKLSIRIISSNFPTKDANVSIKYDINTDGFHPIITVLND
ncbi:MAG: hypothetical protein WC955_12070 [Elusimicrobiota bacterium]